MSKIIKISAKGLKGRDFEYPIKPFTLFWGNSRSGKSAVIDAVLLALYGYHPDIGKRNMDTRRLMGSLISSGAASMRVGLDLDSGISLSRQWEIVKGTVKSTDFVPDGWTIPMVLGSMREYLGLPDREQLKCLFKSAVVNPDAISATALCAEIKSVKVNSPSKHSEIAIQECVDEIMALDMERKETGVSHQEWLDQVIEALRIRQKDAAAAAKAAQGFAITQVVIRPDDVRFDIDRVKSDLHVAEKEKNVIVTERARVDSELIRARQNAAKKTEMETLVANVPDHSNKIVELQSSIQELDAKLSSYKSKTPSIGIDLALAENDLTNYNEQSKSIRTQIQSAEKEHAEKLQHEMCPYCGADTLGWKSKIETEYSKKIATFEAQAQSVAKEMKSVSKSLVTLKVNRDKARQEDAEFNTIRTKMQEKQKVLNALQDSQQALVGAKANLAAVPVIPDIPKLAADVAALDTKFESLDCKIKELRESERQYTAYQIDELRRAQARERAEAANAAFEITKLTIKTVDEFKRRACDSVFIDLTKRAREFTDGIMPPLEFRDGELGYFDRHNWVSHWTWSGTEKAIGYAGFAVALAVDSLIKVVIIDELGIVDPVTKTTIVDKLTALVENRIIDNAILCDVRVDDNVHKILDQHPDTTSCIKIEDDNDHTHAAAIEV